MSFTARAYESFPDLTLNEVVEEYPEVPRLVALKIDVKRRGVFYTDAALSAVDPTRHMLRTSYIFGSRDEKLTPLPESLMLRDGASIITDPTPLERNPYVVDLVNGQLTLMDQGDPIEEVELWPKPAYYDKVTRSGIPMKHILYSRPQRLNVYQFNYCHFWTNGHGCRFCDFVPNLKQQRSELRLPGKISKADLLETLQEALREPARYVGMCLTAGSNPNGNEPFDQELEDYIELLQTIGTLFRGKRFPSQLLATAFTEKQLRRLHDETGLMGYTANIEVLNERMFSLICPGKAEWVGYQEWKRRLIAAVKIFGRGNVETGIVGGVELAAPHGFATEDDALAATLDEAESLAANGVTTVYIVWVPRPGSQFGDQRNPSLEYYVRLAMGLHDLRVKYGLTVDPDSYRHCGNHPDVELSRLLPPRAATAIRRESSSLLGDELVAMLRQYDTVKVLVSADEHGVPEGTVAESLTIGADGTLIYPELLESSATQRNLLRSLWHGGRVSIVVTRETESYQIRAIPFKTVVAGPVFQEHYARLRQALGDVDLAALWLLRPEQVIHQSPLVRQEQERTERPFLSHLDRLIQHPI